MQTLPALKGSMKGRRMSAQALLIAAVVFLSGATLAASRHPGRFLWENRGQSEPAGAGLAVAAAQNVVVASGNVCDAPTVTSCNWFVRAADATTGVTKWEDRLNAGQFDRSQSVWIDDGRVFASGWFQVPFQPATGKGLFDFVVRAYDANSGLVLWQQQIDRGIADFAEQLTVSQGRVYAVGRVRGASGGSDFAIFAFDAITGTELWESVTNRFQVDIAFAVAGSADAVFAAGPVRNFSSLLVRAYDAHTGIILWEDEISGGQMFVKDRSQLTTQGGTLYLAAGITAAAGDEDALVRAYDAKSGALRWTQQRDGGGNDEAVGVAAHGNQLFVVGEDGADANFLSGFLTVKALNRNTGDVQWQDHFQLAPAGDAFANSLVVSGGALFTGGGAQNASGDYVWVVRVYDLQSGALLNADENDAGAINEMTTDGQRVYATGFLGSNSIDFAVRAYDSDPGQ